MKLFVVALILGAQMTAAVKEPAQNGRGVKRTAGMPSKFLCCLAARSRALWAPVQATRSQDQIAVTIDGQPFTTYYFGPETAKPYLMPLRTASGVVVTRGFPVVNDVSSGNPKGPSFEPHQRPLYFGHGDIDGLDFWQEPVFDKYYDDHGKQAYGHMLLKEHRTGDR